MPTVRTFIAALSKLAPARPPAGGRGRQPGVILPGLSPELAEDPYVRAGVEPPLREVLRDPIVRAVMRGDGVEPAEVRRVLRVARRCRPPS
jgi:hypothetical protein